MEMPQSVLGRGCDNENNDGRGTQSYALLDPLGFEFPV